MLKCFTAVLNTEIATGLTYFPFQYFLTVHNNKYQNFHSGQSSEMKMMCFIILQSWKDHSNRNSTEGTVM